MMRHPECPPGVRPRAGHAAAKARASVVPTAYMHTRPAHRGTAAMMPAAAPDGETAAAAVAPTMPASATVPAAGLGDRKCGSRNGEKGDKRNARKAGHDGTLHRPCTRNKTPGGMAGFRSPQVPGELRCAKDLRRAGFGNPLAHPFVRHSAEAGAGIVGHMLWVAGPRDRTGDGRMTDDELEQEL